MDNRSGGCERPSGRERSSGCKKDDYENDQIFHGGQDRKMKLKNICDETLRIQK
jgi:hypothetical protein